MLGRNRKSATVLARQESNLQKGGGEARWAKVSLRRGNIMGAEKKDDNRVDEKGFSASQNLPRGAKRGGPKKRTCSSSFP